jgi:uncharacterized protein (TIGR02001 family)
LPSAAPSFVSGRSVAGALLIPLALVLAPDAAAQVAASTTFTTNDLYRGISFSAGEPALALSVAYDDRSGLYAGGSLNGEITRDDGAQFLGHQEYLGYAHRLRGGSTVDLGVSNLEYRYYGEVDGHADATEIYAGWAKGLFNAYVHYSPNYFRPGNETLYGEVNGAVRLPRPWRLFGHAGALTPLGGRHDGKERYDLRAGIAVALKQGEAQLAWTTAIPLRTYFDPPSQGRGVVALALTWFF